ncbi:MAG: DUF308 domain-containing protein [Clostridia bacterium]|nr:DUF308 domain-containing protein [Clostridia bacterium]
MNILKTEKIKVSVLSLIMIVVGVLFCVLPEKSLSVLEKIASIALIVYGLICVLEFIFTPLILKDSTVLLTGLLSIAVGSLITFVSTIFIFVIGIAVAFNGAERIAYSTDLKTAGDKKWWIDFLLGFLMFALGVATMILCNTNIAHNSMMIYFGISIIVDGLTNLILVCVLGRKLRRVKKFINEKGEEFTDFKVK